MSEVTVSTITHEKPLLPLGQGFTVRWPDQGDSWPGEPDDPLPAALADGSLTAVCLFLDWLYDAAPVWPDASTREELMALYRAYREMEEDDDDE